MRTIKGCNVAVVGGAGFLGSHLVEYLIRDRGCKVLVIDNLCVGRLEFLLPQADFHHHDITGSEDHLREVFRKFGVKYVFNYAAWPYIPECFERPLHVFNVNATAAIKVINAAQEAGAGGVLQVSSAEIYGDCNDTIDEAAPVRPHSTYGAAKAAVDYYCQAAWRERQTPVIALRQFNCVGERETHPYVVPEIVSQLAVQQEQKIRLDPGHPSHGEGYWIPGNGTTGTVKLGNNSFRDFLYAGDQARIAVELLERGQWGEVYNLGSETGVKIYDLANMVGRLMGFTDVVVEQDSARVRPWEIWHLQSDNAKLRAALGDAGHWNLVPLEESLKRTIAWFEGNGRKWPWQK